MQRLIGTIVNGREWTEEDYKQWRLAQMGRGERFEALRDKLAERLTNANEVAISYVNDATPGIYTLNRNYAAYEVSDAGGDFILYDEQTVRRLIAEQPDLMPYYPKEKAVRRNIDLEYGKKQITNAVTSGILMGRSTREIAADLRRRITDMEIESAIRAARTAVTAAENGGRQATYEKAAEMGIDMEREWIATKDHRTRKWHGIADGQRVGMEEAFTVGGEKLMFPGDTSHGASGWNIYNCRCSVKAVVKGHGRKRETYTEWLEKQKEQEKSQISYGKTVDKSTGSSIIKSGKDERKPLQEPDTETITIDSERVFKAAKDGTRHAGVYRDAVNKSKPRLLKSIKSHEEQVRLHADKIAHPEKYDANWLSKSEQEREGLLRKWRKDMQRNAEQAAIEKETLKERFGEK